MHVTNILIDNVSRHEERGGSVVQKDAEVKTKRDRDTKKKLRDI